MNLSQYRAMKEQTLCGEVTLRTDLRDSIEGKDVLIVEDIVDTRKKHEISS